MKKIFILVALATALAGCSSNYHSNASDTLFTLTNRHIAYRDLTVPQQEGNMPKKVTLTPMSIEP